MQLREIRAERSGRLAAWPEMYLYDAQGAAALQRQYGELAAHTYGSTMISGGYPPPVSLCASAGLMTAAALQNLQHCTRTTRKVNIRIGSNSAHRTGSHTPYRGTSVSNMSFPARRRLTESILPSAIDAEPVRRAWRASPRAPRQRA